MKLCCSIAPSTMSEALVMMKKAGKQADLVEVRIDSLPVRDISLLFQKPHPPLIITNRLASEGGKFIGTLREHLNILKEAARLGAEYVDIEMRCGTRAVKELIASSPKTKVIVSYHNFEKTPGNLLNLYSRMKTTGAHIIKIATMAKDISDNQRMFELLDFARRERQPLIALCMGERGQISRILQGKYRGFLTYAPLESSTATAPGQYTIMDLIKTFRVPILRSRTKVFGLIGNPVSSSKGIYFHNNIFTEKKLDAVYVNFLVDDLYSFMETYRGLAQGFSVTMPFKQAIIPLIDRIKTDIAELQAVNTIIKRRNTLIGTNTDVLAIIACLKRRTSIKGKNILVLGTGATARTMAFGAVTNGASVAIVGRTPHKVRELADEFSCAWFERESLRNNIRVDIVMNGTNVGMNSTTDIPFDIDKNLKKDMIVFDAVYSPPDTPLLHAAAAKGCTVITGLELFQTQAKLQSKLFIESL